MRRNVLPGQQLVLHEAEKVAVHDPFAAEPVPVLAQEVALAVVEHEAPDGQGQTLPPPHQEHVLVLVLVPPPHVASQLL